MDTRNDSENGHTQEHSDCITHRRRGRGALFAVGGGLALGILAVALGGTAQADEDFRGRGFGDEFEHRGVERGWAGGPGFAGRGGERAWREHERRERFFGGRRDERFPHRAFGHVVEGSSYGGFPYTPGARGW